MADDFTRLNVGTGGDAMDEEGVLFPSDPTTRKRARVQVTGATAQEVGRVLNADPGGAEYGLVTRNIPSGCQQVVVSAPGEQLYEYGESHDVASGTPTNVTAFTVAAGKTFYFSGVVVGGNVDASFKIYCGSTMLGKVRNSTASPTYQMHFTHVHPDCPAGDLVRVEVTHTNDGIAADFEATILGWLV